MRISIKSIIGVICLLINSIACNTSSVHNKEIMEQLREDSIASSTAESTCAEPPDCDSLQSTILQRPILKKGKEYMFQFFKDSLGHFSTQDYKENGTLYMMGMWISIDEKGNGLVEKTPKTSHYSKNELRVYHSLFSFFEKNTKWLPLKLKTARKGIDCTVSVWLTFEKDYIIYRLGWEDVDIYDLSCNELDSDTIQIR